MVRRMMTLLAGVLLVALATTPAAAERVQVVQPNQHYAGRTYGQWSAAWWKWAAGIAVPNSPLDDATGHNCAVGQRGPVWFLAGTADGSTVTRRCSVPAGKAILFPLLNTECSSVEGNGNTPRELRSCAASIIDDVTETSASVDGRPLDLGRQSSDFRFQSPPFKITFVSGNPFGVMAGTGLSVADGYWVLLRPLASGSHTIDFHGRYMDFVIDVHYVLNVECGR